MKGQTYIAVAATVVALAGAVAAHAQTSGFRVPPELRDTTGQASGTTDVQTFPSGSVPSIGTTNPTQPRSVPTQ
jgi:hypothetical protein